MLKRPRNMLAEVAQFLSRYSTQTNSVLGVGVSGGVDSVCLLTILRELSVQPHVIHINHHLRGRDSDRDEEFVRELSAGLPFHRFDADLTDVQGNLEQAAREARRGFFAKLLDSHVVDAVALAHTRDDQAETVLMRLLRGSGLRGLAAMRPRTGRFLRPLLDCSRTDVEAFLLARGIGWRDDASNRDARFTRNRIRHELLPVLERDYNPEVRLALSHLAATAGSEEDWWRLQMDVHPAIRVGNGAAILDIAVVGEIHPAVLRRLIRRAIEIAKGDLRGITFDHVEAVAELALRAEGSGKVPLVGAMSATRSFDQLRIACPAPKAEGYCLAVVPGETQSGQGIVFETVDPAGHVKVKEDLAWGRVPTPLQLRAWQPGDAYRPVGETREKKLKELFHRARVPVWDRGGWPVLAGDGRIVWAKQFGPAADVAAAPDSRRVLRVHEAVRDGRSGCSQESFNWIEPEDPIPASK